MAGETPMNHTRPSLFFNPRMSPVVLVLALWLVAGLGVAQTSQDSARLAQIRTAAAVLEADRQLLVELRKEFPDDKVEAESYLERLRDLALKSDPQRLGPLAAKVMQIAPAYLKWRDTQFASSEEAAREYVRSGAREFRTAFTNLTNAILQTVANHLDTLLDQIGTPR